MPEPKPIHFKPTNEDAEVIRALQTRLGISGTALLRVCLRDKAIQLGVWAPRTEQPTTPTGTDG